MRSNLYGEFHFCLQTLICWFFFISRRILLTRSVFGNFSQLLGGNMNGSYSYKRFLLRGLRSLRLNQQSRESGQQWLQQKDPPSSVDFFGNEKLCCFLSVLLRWEWNLTLMGESSKNRLALLLSLDSPCKRCLFEIRKENLEYPSSFYSCSCEAEGSNLFSSMRQRFDQSEISLNEHDFAGRYCDFWKVCRNYSLEYRFSYRPMRKRLFLIASSLMFTYIYLYFIEGVQFHKVGSKRRKDNRDSQLTL